MKVRTKGNFVQVGDDYYSYDTCIRTVLVSGGLRRTVGNTTKYSRTTSAHQREACVDDCDVRLSGVPRGADADLLQRLALALLGTGRL